MTKLSYLDDPESEKFVIDQLLTNWNLSTWEQNFVKSVKEYSDNGGFLSDKQKQKLSDLWEKY